MSGTVQDRGLLGCLVGHSMHEHDNIGVDVLYFGPWMPLARTSGLGIERGFDQVIPGDQPDPGLINCPGPPMRH